MRIRSLRARLTLWYTGLLTITLLLLGGVAYGLMVNSLSRSVDATLEKVSQVLSEQARRETAAFFPPEVAAMLRRLLGFSPSDQYVEMLDPFGHRDPRLSRPSAQTLHLSPQARNNAARGLETFETIHDEAFGPYPIRLLTQPVIEAGRIVNLVQVGFPLRHIYEARRHFVRTMALVFPVALLLAGGGGWLLAHRALAPVAQMTAATQRISAEHLAERLEESGTGDELDQLASTLNAMLERLDNAFHQIRQFSADASHELQTPLTILKGELEVALRSPRTVAAYQGLLHSALEEIDRIAVLVDGLMLLARADAGVLRMDHRPVELHQLVQEVYGQSKILADAKAINVHLGRLEPLVILGDYERLRRLLLNLADNAIKYTPPSGHVTLALRRQGDRAELQVTDTGIGLSPQEQTQIFQRFYRTSEARRFSAVGSGLGLCIARSIVAAHGGTITLESAAGRGSTFTVCLPLPHPG
jgi:heavy metal sensor kinase